MMLDTNVLIYLFKRDEGVTLTLDAWKKSGKEFSFSSLTLAELLAFEHLSAAEEEHILNLAQTLHVVAITAEIGKQAGYIRRTYHTPLADSIIAATALSADIPLVTRNIKDFQQIKDLRLIKI